MHTYEIRCGTRVVSHVKSHTPRHAVTDYLRSQGCSDDELEPLGNDGVAWRGAVYTAVEHTDQSASTPDSPQAASEPD
jgi:hypothetical protein